MGHYKIIIEALCTVNLGNYWMNEKSLYKKVSDKMTREQFTNKLNDMIASGIVLTHKNNRRLFRMNSDIISITKIRLAQNEKITRSISNSYRTV